ncbi:hypothetical protein VN97_g9204 [Penicillium thymicola]|uniref:Uncharacterized protein n=1 Tax=Penicillium thymicola TaxID=293382 RepID=A0AAI9TC12_PENTH|nr:hypothetical protein VN97_g9204 [Penicillium thymicola]
MACCDCTHTLSSSEKGDELSDPKMLSLPGGETPEEARLEREGCVRNLQVFRYNLYQKESKVYDYDAFADLLYYEEKLRRNCQSEIILRHDIKKDPSFWDTRVPSFEDEMSTLYQENWMLTRGWWYTRGWIIGISGPLQRMDTMDDQVDPYQRRICLVSIWGLSVDEEATGCQREREERLIPTDL